MLIVSMMAVPLAACLLIAVLPSKLPRAVFETVHVASIVLMFVLCVIVVGIVVIGGTPISAMDSWLYLDTLGVIFTGIVVAVGSFTGICAVPYINHDVRDGEVPAAKTKQFFALFNLFLFTMLLVTISNNIIMMWVSIEATTLATVFLVGFYNKRVSLEAAWKYLIVCTAGVAFGLYGTLLVYANAADVMADPHNAVFWNELLPYAKMFDPALIQIAFVFATIGFGTKAGLFPMHMWLPDAHSQAPSPVSGLLSGALTKCAILVVIRFYVLAIQAVGPTFPRTIMLVIGVLSVVYGAFAVLTQSHFKRKLAYSTTENIGIVALCLGFGGPIGIAAALLHCVFHSLIKSLMFCLSGNLLAKYKTSELPKISGVVKVAPVTAVLLGIGLFALSGFPPLALFISEIMAFMAGIAAGYMWLVVIVGLALTIVIGAFTIVFLKSVLGEAPKNMERGEVSVGMLIPEIVLVVIVLWFGVATPAPVLDSVEAATSIVLQEDGSQWENVPFFADVA